jgi:predicted RNA-binding Zn ribbon-like protein
MRFDSFQESLPALMVDLVNTYDVKCKPPEQLRSPADLENLLRGYRMLGANRASEADVREMRVLRDQIRSVFEADDEDETHVRLNQILAAAHVVPRVVRERRGERKIYFAPQEAPLARRVACDAGLGLAMMLTSHPNRLKVCAAGPCRNVFIDTTRNRSRRWCSDACGGRVNVAAHRARRRTASNSVPNS